MSEKILKSVWDKKASTYDLDYRSTNISKWIHERTLSILRDSFQVPADLLEIGCGTGDEMISMASSGKHVFAIDISEGMIKVAQEKAKSAGVIGNCDFKVLAAQQLNLIDSMRFDGAYSLMGPLNCVEDLSGFANTLGTILKPKSLFVVSIINKHCPWEVLYYSLKGMFGTAFRRYKKQPVQAVVDNAYPPVDLWYYTPQQFFAHFSQSFSIKYYWALPLFVPPPYMENVYNRFKPLFRGLSVLEKYVAPYFPFNMLGDHFIMVMQRNEK